MNDFPLVSIGMPTYNRASVLSRAIESALAQDYPNLELVISNNASTDETEAICEEFARRDGRVRYLRQEKNLGATGNFVEALNQSRGEFFIWLADDDWLDASYVSACVSVLQENPDYSLVCGKTIYMEGEKQLFVGEKMNLSQRSGLRRVLAYYRRVEQNGTFYGVMRREQLLKVPLLHVLGGDWFLVAAMCFLGKVRSLDGVELHRSLGGASANIKSLITMFGLAGFGARNPNLLISFNILKNLAWQAPTYASLGKMRRLLLGFLAFLIVYNRYGHYDKDSLRKVFLGLRSRLKSLGRSVGITQRKR